LSNGQHIEQEDLALYSMQALTPAESAEAKTHLDTCATCLCVLADMLADVSLIAMTVPQEELPEGARQRFAAAIAKTPQLSGMASKAAPVAAGRPPIRHKHKHSSALGWFEWAITAASLAVACYLGYHSFELQRELDANRVEIAQLSVQAAHAQELQGLMDALSSPDAKRVTLTETRGPAQPIGHATYLPRSGALIFVASNLRPVPQSKTYELWLIPANGKAPIPAGLFRPDAKGSASVVLPPLPEGVDAKAFGVTVETAEGASTPTLPIVMSGQ
jgi:Anti-sigma-K factor rskA